ncbi:hypothetical protein [Nocardioides montaniterrae]
MLVCALSDVLLLGSLAAVHDSSDGGRWWFLARPRSWQVLEMLVAAAMLLVAARLAFG